MRRPWPIVWIVFGSLLALVVAGAMALVDAGPISTLVIVPKLLDSKSALFLISLWRSNPFGLSLAQTRSPGEGEVFRSEIAGCAYATTFPDERIVTRRGPIILTHSRCGDPEPNREVASATIALPDGEVLLQATGTRETFDLGAVRKILQSVH